jgi:hypothetical protein
MNARAWKAFAAIQVVGVGCYLGAPHVPCCGPEIFFSGVVLLLPGSPVGLSVVEKLVPGLFSPSRIGGAIGEVSVAVAVNALVWLGVARWARHLARRRPRGGSGSRDRDGVGRGS